MEKLSLLKPGAMDPFQGREIRKLACLRVGKELGFGPIPTSPGKYQGPGENPVWGQDLGVLLLQEH